MIVTDSRKSHVEERLRLVKGRWGNKPYRLVAFSKKGNISQQRLKTRHFVSHQPTETLNASGQRAFTSICSPADYRPLSSASASWSWSSTAGFYLTQKWSCESLMRWRQHIWHSSLYGSIWSSSSTYWEMCTALPRSQSGTLVGGVKKAGASVSTNLPVALSVRGNGCVWLDLTRMSSQSFVAFRFRRTHSHKHSCAQTHQNQHAS